MSQESTGVVRQPLAVKGHSRRHLEERLGLRFPRALRELRFEPEELTDLGDRLLVVARMKGSGLSSGAAFDSDFANLLMLSGGRVIREQMFLDRGEALKAAGLSGCPRLT